MERVTREEALECVKKLILHIGDNPDREGLLETPSRVLKAYEELFSGYGQDPRDILKKRFSTQSEEMVVLSDIDLYSTCEHHMLPFTGKCHIAYLPDGHVAGISKLARLVQVFARRLQIQEELACQIAESLHDALRPRGTAVIIEARHMCMACRGVKQPGSKMVTSAMLGLFKEDERLRAEFFRVIKD